MPRFLFNLQPVLDQRARRERDAQIAHARVERERAALEQTLRACQRDISTLRADWRRSLAGRAPTPDAPARLDLREVRLQSASSLRLLSRAQDAAIRLAGVLKRLEASRADLLSATTARKAVESLRDRRYEAWKRALDRKEAAELDDLATTRAALAGASDLAALERLPTGI